MRAKLLVLIAIVLIASGCNATNSTELHKADTKSRYQKRDFRHR